MNKQKFYNKSVEQNVKIGLMNGVETCAFDRMAVSLQTVCRRDRRTIGRETVSLNIIWRMSGIKRFCESLFPHFNDKKCGKGSETRREFCVNGVDFSMIKVDGGEFSMGDDGEQVKDNPAHKVRVSDFLIGQTEVTQALWEAVMGNNPSYSKGEELPVEQVSWEDCMLFVQKLNELTKENFRLPSEAEWEFAARGGNKSRGYKYSGSDNLKSVAWCVENKGHGTHAVAKKKPNELGLYDMSGNVYEWCNDWYDEQYYRNSPYENPVGSANGLYKVLRGGSYRNKNKCKVNIRHYNAPYYKYGNIGLRLSI